jgi:predicted DNA binding CopG/RHH family protein
LKEKKLRFCLLRVHMEELKAEFIKETVRFAAEWYKKTAKQYITKYPEVTLSLSEAQIARMKSKINELVGNSEKMVRGRLG